MRFFDNDRWRGEFQVSSPGKFRLHNSGLGGNAFATWTRDFLKKNTEAGQDISVDLLIGAELVRPRRAGRAVPMRRS